MRCRLFSMMRFRDPMAGVAAAAPLLAVDRVPSGPVPWPDFGNYPGDQVVEIALGYQLEAFVEIVCCLFELVDFALDLLLAAALGLPNSAAGALPIALLQGGGAGPRLDQSRIGCPTRRIDLVLCPGLGVEDLLYRVGH
jgi:hypothetical protein